MPIKQPFLFNISLVEGSLFTDRHTRSRIFNVLIFKGRIDRIEVDLDQKLS